MCADTGLTGFRRNRRPTEGVADRLLPRIRPREHLHGIVAAIGIKLLDAPVTGRLAVLVGGFRGMGEGGTIGARRQLLPMRSQMRWRRSVSRFSSCP